MNIHPALLSIPLAVGLGSCAILPRPTPAADPTTAVAPAAAVADAKAADLELAAPDDASGWLKRGFELLRVEQNVAAAYAFRTAIGTNTLNDAGRALGYWHIYLAEQGSDRHSAASDALSSFVVVAEDILQIRASLRYAEDGSQDFVDRFDLKRRLARARAVLSASWSHHALAFGRSEGHPVPVHSLVEQDYFLEMATPCGDHAARHEGPEAGNNHLLQVELTCPGVPPAHYFLERVAEE